MKAKPKAGTGPTTRPTSSVGMNSGAHPTAPGGMSRKALITELTTDHGFEDGPEWTDYPWPELIQLVIDERRAREQEEPEDRDPNPGIFKSAHTMFEVEPDPDADLIDSEGQAAVDLFDVDITEVDDDFSVLAPSTDASAAFDDDGILDPEQMFAEMYEARNTALADEPPPIFLGIPGVKDYIFDGHAGAGPSGAERWMNCTMSLSASRRFLETLTPNQQREFAGAGTAARQGTTAHAVAEVEANFILGRADTDEVTLTLTELAAMPDEEAEAYSPEMAEYVTEYTDLVKSYADERGSDNVLIESRVEALIPLVGVHEGETYAIRGSADLAVKPMRGARVRKDLRTLVVGDLKYGNGIDVDVDENPQIRLYALGVLATLIDDEGNLPAGLEEIVYHIIQPRLGGIKTWTESVDDLLAWRDDVLAPALTLALFGADEGATFEPSELACQFCPARGGCPALAEQRIADGAALFEAVADAEFADGPGSVPDVTALDSARLGELLSAALGIKKITDDLKAEAQRRLHRDEPVPGFVLVNYSPRRAWVGRADEALSEMPGVWTEPQLMSPTQALAAVKGDKERTKAVERFVSVPDKRPVIAPEGDRRSLWKGAAPEAMFKDETKTGDE